MRSNPSSSKNLVVRAAVRKFLSATLSSPKKLVSESSCAKLEVTLLCQKLENYLDYDTA